MSCDDMQMWLGTLETLKLACTYNAVKCQKEAKFVAPEFRIVSTTIEKDDHCAMRQIKIHESDDVMMARFVKGNSELVQAEYEYWASLPLECYGTSGDVVFWGREKSCRLDTDAATPTGVAYLRRWMHPFPTPVAYRGKS